MASDPYYKRCARECDECDGRITWEHAIVYAGKQLNEKWAIIPLCEFHHAVNRHQDGKGLDKTENVRIALNRASEDELRAVSRAINYVELRERLNKSHDSR